MAKIVYLPDGSMEVLFSVEDYFRLLEERAGKDAGEIARALAYSCCEDAAQEIILNKEIN